MTSGAVVEIVSEIEGEVRERIRSAGTDPRRDVDQVRTFVQEALNRWEHRSLTGAVPPITDAHGTAKAVMDAVAGFGPLQQYLDDPHIEAICTV